MKSLIQVLMFVAVSVLVAACGGPLSDGAWTTECMRGGSGSHRVGLTFEKGKQFKLSRSFFSDGDCSEPVETQVQTGSVRVSRSGKSGVLDSMVFDYDESFSVIPHTKDSLDHLVESWKSARASKEDKVDPKASIARQRAARKTNDAIESVRKLPEPKLNQATTMTRKEVELMGLRPMRAFSSRMAATFQSDGDSMILRMGSRAHGDEEDSLVFFRQK